jgi:hypothetical protein
MKIALPILFRLGRKTLLLLSPIAFFCVASSASTWTLDTSIGSSFETHVSGMPQQTPTAMDTSSGTALYVACSYVAGDFQTYSRIHKWTSNSWSQVYNGVVSGTISSMSYYSGSNLLIGGYFSSIGETGVSATNLAILNVASGSIQAASQGLYAVGTVEAVKSVTWQGASETRQYFYVAGSITRLGSTLVNCIGRTRLVSGSYSTETMNGGLPEAGHTSIRITSMDVDPSILNGSAYVHRVYIAGAFSKLGSSSVSSTNLGVWDEKYSAWSNLGASGKGVGTKYTDIGCVTNVSHLWAAPHSVSLSGTTLYIIGGFNTVNGTDHVVSGGTCNWWGPICAAKVTSSFTLGPWTTGASSWQRLWDYTGSDVLRGGKVAAVGSEAYVTCNTGASPSGGGTVYTAFHVNGNTWTPIGPTASTGSVPSQQYYLPCAGGTTTGFFAITDSTVSNGSTIRRYYLAP